MANLLQINLNRTWRAQDIMAQTVAECNAVACLVSEPAGVPDSPRWFSSVNGLAAVYAGGAAVPSLLSLYRRGNMCVAVNMNNVLLISCYISPNCNLAEYRIFLDELTDILSSARNRQVLLAGDFNAHSPHWGSSFTSSKGELLENWASGLVLRLVNIGNVATCVRWNGSSIVDLTWASPGLVGQVVDWRVRGELESFFDHLYVSFSIRNVLIPPRGKIFGLRWNLKKLDRELLQESFLWSCSIDPSPQEREDSNPGCWMDRVLREACDAAAPRIYARRPSRSVYWWDDAIDGLRRSAAQARRRFYRAKRRRDEDEVHIAHLSYKRCKSELNREIARAKDRAWRDLLVLVEEDPWGFPYRTIVKRLSASSNLTQVLESGTFKGLLDSLFPAGEELPTIHWERDYGFSSNEDWAVTPEEVSWVIREKRRVNTAPGPDGIPSTILKLMPRPMIEKLAACFTACVGDSFPTRGKLPLSC